MDSMPPARIMSWSPSSTPLAASWMALRPEPQTLLMVRAEVDEGRPPRSAAWRVGAWPSPAVSTLPRTAWRGASPGTCRNSSFTTWAARSGAIRGERPPDLAAQVVKELLRQVPGAEPTEAIFGNVLTAGEGQ